MYVCMFDLALETPPTYPRGRGGGEWLEILILLSVNREMAYKQVGLIHRTFGLAPHPHFAGGI